MNALSNFVHFTRRNRATVFIPAIGVTAEFDDFRTAIKFATGKYRKYAHAKDYTVSRSISVYYNGKMYDNTVVHNLCYGSHANFNSNGADEHSLEYGFRFYRWCFLCINMKASECLSKAREDLNK